MKDLPASEFRRQGRQVIDWAAKFFDRIDDIPVFPAVNPGDVLAQLPESPPEDPEPWDDILADLDQVIVPATTHWNHPSFHAYFSHTGSGPGILGETLAAALNTNAMLWRTGPAATELEMRMAAWVAQLLHLPSTWQGVMQDTASVSSLVALAAARHAATGGSVRDQGISGPSLRLYCSVDAHSSIEKAAIILGLGRDNVCKIRRDDQFRIDVDHLRECVEADRVAGHRPMAVSACVGTTTTTAVDPIPAIADLCEERDLWLHVDAAYAGPLAMLDEYRWINDGCDRADSYVVNPHKWMFVPHGCSLLYSPRLDDVRAALSLIPDYLQTPEQGETLDLMNYTPALGRPNRALKLWTVIRSFGARGMASRLQNHLDLTQRFVRWVDATDDFEVMVPARMSLVLFRHRPDNDIDLNEHNRELMEHVNATGRVFLSPTQLDDDLAIRFTIGNLRTDEKHVDLCCTLLRQAADALQS